MIRATIIFFFIGVIAFVLGANNLAGLSPNVGKIILYAFFALAIISFLINFLSHKNNIKLALLVPSFSLTLASHTAIYAAEKVPITEEIKNEAGNIKTDSNIETRNLKRKLRNATGNESAVKDAKDDINDATDKANNSSNKIRRKDKRKMHEKHEKDERKMHDKHEQEESKMP